jgi:hypothetical protein
MSSTGKIPPNSKRAGARRGLKPLPGGLVTNRRRSAPYPSVEYSSGPCDPPVPYIAVRPRLIK